MSSSSSNSRALSIDYHPSAGNTVVVYDCEQATSRKVAFDFNLPRPSFSSRRRRGGQGESTDSGESLHSIDSRAEANLAYSVVYQAEFAHDDSDESLGPDMDASSEELAPLSIARPSTWFKGLRSKLRAFGGLPSVTK
ncbi:hypothetical protein BKA70DRAFT_1417572 [Coprinopsis sp. MPI-PUGE-AT-0042]|nr:hypothetical protein BKA70DRAFT_1417572 [Coprinopsis sp. MPI-PUGE-AT-0042]